MKKLNRRHLRKLIEAVIKEEQEWWDPAGAASSDHEFVNANEYYETDIFDKEAVWDRVGGSTVPADVDMTYRNARSRGSDLVWSSSPKLEVHTHTKPIVRQVSLLLEQYLSPSGEQLPDNKFDRMKMYQLGRGTIKIEASSPFMVENKASKWSHGSTHVLLLEIKDIHTINNNVQLNLMIEQAPGKNVTINMSFPQEAAARRASGDLKENLSRGSLLRRRYGR